MRVLTAFRQGWKQLFALRGMWLGVYVCNLLFALVAVVPLFTWLSDAAGHSLSLQRSVGQFDYTFYTDLLRNYPGYQGAIGIILLLALLYFIFTGFLMGGILEHFVHRTKVATAHTFLIGGATHFWRILLTGVFFLFIHVILLLIVLAIVLSIGINPWEIENDARLLLQLKVILICYLLVAALVFVIHDYVKVHLVRQYPRGIRFALKRGMRFVRRHFGAVVFLYVINLLLLLMLFAFAFLFKKGISSEITDGLLGFMVSQIIVLGRVGVKLLNLSSANALVEMRQR